MKRFIAGAVLAAAFCSSCSVAGAQDIDAKFTRISMGLTRDAVLAILGHPDAETNSTMLGVPYARLRWNAAARSYVVVFVVDRVVETKQCAGTADC